MPLSSSQYLFLHRMPIIKMEKEKATLISNEEQVSVDDVATEALFGEEIGEEVTSVLTDNHHYYYEEPKGRCFSGERMGLLFGITILLAFTVGIVAISCSSHQCLQSSNTKSNASSASEMSMERGETFAPTASSSAIQIETPIPTKIFSLAPTPSFSTTLTPLFSIQQEATLSPTKVNPVRIALPAMGNEEELVTSKAPTVTDLTTELPSFNNVASDIVSKPPQFLSSAPTTSAPSLSPTTSAPTSVAPSTIIPSFSPSTLLPSASPTEETKSSKNSSRRTQNPTSTSSILRAPTAIPTRNGAATATPPSLETNSVLEASSSPSPEAEQLPRQFTVFGDTPLPTTSPTGAKTLTMVPTTFTSSSLLLVTEAPSTMPTFLSQRLFSATTSAPTSRESIAFDPASFVSTSSNPISSLDPQGRLILLPFLAEYYRGDSLVTSEQVDHPARFQSFGVPDQAVTLRYTTLLHVVDAPVRLMVELWYGWEQVDVWIDNSIHDEETTLSVGSHSVLIECRGMPGKGIEFNAAIFVERVFYSMDEAAVEIRKFLEKHEELGEDIALVTVDVGGSNDPYLEIVVDATTYDIWDTKVFLILTSPSSVNWIVEGSNVIGVAFSHQPATRVHGVEWMWPVLGLQYSENPDEWEKLVAGKGPDRSVKVSSRTALVVL